MWVVYSVSPQNDLKNGDLRRRLIEHAIDPKALTRELDKADARAESEFEKLVIQRLVKAQYKVIPQWEVGRYRIDIVVEGENARLAVECDGDRYHPIEKLPDDMARQATLERIGWKFHRIRGSEFFRDPDRAMERLIKRLGQLGIEPVSLCHEPDQTYQIKAIDTLAPIIRAAEGLRLQWEKNDDGLEDVGPVESPEIESGPEQNKVADKQRQVPSSNTDKIPDRSDSGTLFPPDTEENVQKIISANYNQQSATEPAILEADIEHPSKSDVDGTLTGGLGTALMAVPDAHVSVTDAQRAAISEAELGVSGVTADTWFGLAKWARENSKLTSLDCKFAYSQGIRVKRGLPPTKKQLEDCLRILRQATELGFAFTEN
jgi:very-short-patch-repair endonuclease